MFALFDEAGKFLTGRVMSEAESSLQIELDTGKRVKVKAANVLLRFDKPAPAALMGAAQALAPVAADAQAAGHPLTRPPPRVGADAHSHPR